MTYCWLEAWLEVGISSLAMSFAGRPDSGRTERGTPREVQRLALGEIHREDMSPHDMASSAVSSSDSARSARASPRRGYLPHLDVQRHLEVWQE